MTTLDNFHISFLTASSKDEIHPFCLGRRNNELLLFHVKFLLLHCLKYGIICLLTFGGLMRQLTCIDIILVKF